MDPETQKAMEESQANMANPAAIFSELFGGGAGDAAAPAAIADADASGGGRRGEGGGGSGGGDGVPRRRADKHSRTR